MSIRLQLIGVANCTSSLIQGLYYCSPTSSAMDSMHPDLGDYTVTEIEPVVAFDLDARKEGKDVAEAIFAPPNNWYRIPGSAVSTMIVPVLMGPVLDGVPSHLAGASPAFAYIPTMRGCKTAQFYLDETSPQPMSDESALARLEEFAFGTGAT